MPAGLLARYLRYVDLMTVHGPNLGMPHSRALGDGLFELRHVGKLNTRILWFFRKGRRIVAVHGIRNKGSTISAHDLDTARERMRDWNERDR